MKVKKTFLATFLVVNLYSCGLDFYASNYDFETTAIYTAPQSNASAVVLTKGYVPRGADLGDENECLVDARITFNEKPSEVIEILSNGVKVFSATISGKPVSVIDSLNYSSVLFKCSKLTGVKEIDTTELKELSAVILATGYGPKGTFLKGQTKTILVDTVRYSTKDRQLYTTIACQKSGWLNNYEAEKQFVNSISLIYNIADNAAPSASCYTMRRLFIFIATIFISLSLVAQANPTDDEEPYDYDTTLKGGYIVSFKVDDSLQYLYLKKGNKTITKLSSTTRGMPYKNLGYVGADFSNYFVLVHSFGSGNPHYIELIKKSNGKNILKDGAVWIDVEEKKEYLLYGENDMPDKKDKMTLYNVRTGQKQLFGFPTDVFGRPEVLNRIKISKLTDKQLVIKYETEKGSMTKMYSR